MESNFRVFRRKVHGLAQDRFQRGFGCDVSNLSLPRKKMKFFLCASSPLCDIQLVWQYMCVALTVKHNYFIG